MVFRLVVKVWITKTRATEIRFAYCHSQGAFGETTLDRFNSLRIDREVESYFGSCSGLLRALLCSFLLRGLFRGGHIISPEKGKLSAHIGLRIAAHVKTLNQLTHALVLLVFRHSPASRRACEATSTDRSPAVRRSRSSSRRPDRKRERDRSVAAEMRVRF